MSDPSEADQLHDPLVELTAMQEVHAILAKLSPEARGRVVAWAVSVMNVAASPSTPSGRPAASAEKRPTGSTGEGAGDSFDTFAELFSAAAPKTNAEKALVGGYWLQACQGAESFVSMAVNNELKNLGEGVENITTAFDGLKDSKPQLALQLRKEGKSQQARKKYKLSLAGIRLVERMISGEASNG